MVVANRPAKGKKGKQVAEEKKDSSCNNNGTPTTTSNARQQPVNWGTRFYIFGCLVWLAYNITVQFFARQPSVVTVYPGSSVLDLPQFTNDDHQARYLWGSYRPQVYFGMRAKLPTSPLIGLMYFSHHSNTLNLRHTCEHSDHIKKFGWRRHDGVTFGQQVIEEKDGFVLQTEFLKMKGDKRGGSWTARVHGKWPGANDVRYMSVILYVVDEGKRSLALSPKPADKYPIEGSADVLGKYKVKFPHIQSKYKEVHYVHTHASHTHNLTDLIKNDLYHGMQSHPNKIPSLTDNNTMVTDHNRNLVAVQMILQFPFIIDMTYTPMNDDDSIVTPAIHGQAFSKAMKAKTATFDDQFQSKFSISKQSLMEEMKAASNETKNMDQEAAKKFEFAQVAFSNLIGGVGYFYGQSKVIGHGHGPEVLVTRPSPLLTAVPSRSFFPRGFMWDEGFHQLIIQKWDPLLSKEIIGHWFDLMNVDGWIAREQILGDEARSKVPPEFLIQRDQFANPPTFFLALKQLIDSLDNSPSVGGPDYQFVERIYPRLQKWYDWYNVTQIGHTPTSYRWRGRDANATNELNPKTLTSGLDDYPRASHPDHHERHLDLRCWMQLGANVLARMSRLLNKPDVTYSHTESLLKDNDLLNSLHWANKSGRYYDVGNNTLAVSLKNMPVEPNQPAILKRVVRKAPKVVYVPHFGYVSLFPLLLHIIDPASPNLGKVLDDLSNPDLLWSPFGLRSLSKDSKLYMTHNTEHDAPYWRGPVWLNINYLAVRALHHYGNIPGPYKDKASKIYKELRHNLIENMFHQYKATGYIWEQYDTAEGNEGRGKGTHPFTGWSSLVLLIMAESY